MAEKIIKRYKNYGVNINIKEKGITIFQDRFQFRIKLLSSARVEHQKKYVDDVRISLKLPFLRIRQENVAIFILASKKLHNDNSLMRN